MIKRYLSWLGKLDRTKSSLVWAASMTAIMSAMLVVANLLRPLHDTVNAAYFTRSAFFGDISTWPQYVTTGYLPLNVAVAFLMMFCAFRFLSSASPGRSLTSCSWATVSRAASGRWVKFVLAYLIHWMALTGLAMGSFVALALGWFHGLEMLVFGTLYGLMPFTLDMLVLVGKRRRYYSNLKKLSPETLQYAKENGWIL